MKVEQAKQAVAEKHQYDDWQQMIDFLNLDHSREIQFDSQIQVWKEVTDLLGAELEKHRWIPVEERLPEKSGEYIVAKKNGLVCQMSYRLALLEIGKNTFHYHGLEQTSQVTHWRYLPELP